MFGCVTAACSCAGLSAACAGDGAFALFKSTCTRGIYDNMKTVVATIFVGKGVSTIAASCRCAATIWSIRSLARQPSNWEMGQVENHVDSSESASSPLATA
jgi:hypothetical protein